jgi:hypothetical protein
VSELVTKLNPLRIYRVDRRGYSGTSHAAMVTGDELRTLCGRKATGTQWHVSAGLFEATEIECKRCRSNFPFA